MLVVYALGIPLFAFFVLRSIKNDLDKWQTTYGFLYSSYERRTPVMTDGIRRSTFVKFARCLDSLLEHSV